MMATGTVSTAQLENLLAGAKLDVQTQTSARYKRQADEQVSILTELLSLRNAQSEAVAVKALEWEPKGGTHGIYAEDGFGGLYFAYDDGAWSSPRKSFLAPLDGSGSIETAKVAAQADYALTHPAPPLAVTDEMVERALAVWFHPMRTPAGDGYSEGMRAALTAALEAKQ